MNVGLMFMSSRVGGVDDHFISDGRTPVPAAVSLLLLDAGVVTGLVTGITEVGQHVRPQAFIFGGHEAGQIVTWFNPAVTAQLIAMIDAFLLSQRQAFPPLIEVTQSSVDLTVMNTTCDQVLVFVDVKLDSTHTLGVMRVDVLHVLDFIKPLIHLHLFDGVAQGTKGAVTQKFLPHNFCPDDDVRVAVRVLWMRHHARTRVCAPVHLHTEEE